MNFKIKHSLAPHFCLGSLFLLFEFLTKAKCCLLFHLSLERLMWSLGSGKSWRHTCSSYVAKSKTGSKGETSHKPWSRCASVLIFFVDGVWTPLYAPSLSFSFLLDKGLSFFLFLTCLSMWHTFFGYASFISFIFDMPKHVAYLLWVCIFYFLIAPYPWHIFEREVSYMYLEFYFVDGWNFAHF